MNEDSLFINKLNRREFPKVEIHNIVGTGCKMSGGIGDGIVLEKNARLENVENYLIKGKCRDKLNPLHLDLLDFEFYPEVFETPETSEVFYPQTSSAKIFWVWHQTETISDPASLFLLLSYFFPLIQPLLSFV